MAYVDNVKAAIKVDPATITTLCHAYVKRFLSANTVPPSFAELITSALKGDDAALVDVVNFSRSVRTGATYEKSADPLVDNSTLAPQFERLQLKSASGVPLWGALTIAFLWAIFVFRWV